MIPHQKTARICSNNASSATYHPEKTAETSERPSARTAPIAAKPDTLRLRISHARNLPTKAAGMIFQNHFLKPYRNTPVIIRPQFPGKRDNACPGRFQISHSSADDRKEYPKSESFRPETPIEQQQIAANNPTGPVLHAHNLTTKRTGINK